MVMVTFLFSLKIELFKSFNQFNSIQFKFYSHSYKIFTLYIVR